MENVCIIAWHDEVNLTTTIFLCGTESAKTRLADVMVDCRAYSRG
jgi:hypothetical protein